MKRLIRSALNRLKTPPPFKTGAKPNPARDPRDYQVKDLLGGAAVFIPQNCAVPPADRMAPLLQSHADCGIFAAMGCEWATLPPSMRQLLSARAGYVIARQRTWGTVSANWKNDTGLTAPVVMWTYANFGVTPESAWPYAGDFNEQPGAVATYAATPYETTYYAAPQLPDIQKAIMAGLPVFNFFAATQEFWYPVKCADGSYEVDTPTVLSKSIGGHFAQVVELDWNRVCRDGTIGSALVRNSWSTSWAQNGEAWVSIAGWINARGDVGSRYVVVAKVPTNPLPPGVILTSPSPTSPTSPTPEPSPSPSPTNSSESSESSQSVTPPLPPSDPSSPSPALPAPEPTPVPTPLPTPAPLPSPKPTPGPTPIPAVVNGLTYFPSAVPPFVRLTYLSNHKSLLIVWANGVIIGKVTVAPVAGVCRVGIPWSKLPTKFTGMASNGKDTPFTANPLVI